MREWDTSADWIRIEHAYTGSNRAVDRGGIGASRHDAGLDLCSILQEVHRE
jgi:hypothetical protein